MTKEKWARRILFCFSIYYHSVINNLWIDEQSWHFIQPPRVKLFCTSWEKSSLEKSFIACRSAEGSGVDALIVLSLPSNVFQNDLKGFVLFYAIKQIFYYIHENFLNSLKTLYIWPCGILIPWAGIEPSPPALEAWSLNRWTAGKVTNFSEFLFYRSLFVILISISYGCKDTIRH